PLFLLLDDLQWASTTTLQLLHYLTRNIRGSRILVVGTYRSEEVQTEEGHPLLEMRRRLSREGLLREIQLARLTRDDLWQMLGDLFPEGGLGEEFLAWLFEETEGNPFFVLEVLKLLRDKGALSKDEAGWHADERLAGSEIPSGIFDVIARRVEAVGEEQRDLLDCAAVLGRRFDLSILVSVLGGSRLDLLKRLRVLGRRYQLIASDDGKYRFTHSKIREMLYDELPYDLRREYHLTIARCIEEMHSSSLEEVIYDLAHHYFKGGNAEKALVYSLKAADRAERLYALDEALQFYLVALSVLDEGEETPESKGQRIEILRRRGGLLSTLSRREAALESLVLALRLSKELGDETRQSNLLTEMADLQMRMGNWEQALALCAESMGVSRKVEDLRQMARAFSVMGTALFLKGDWEASIRHYEEGLLLSERAGDEVQRARILGNLGNVHDAQGEEGKAIEHYEKAIAILEGEGLPLEAALGYLNLGYAHASLEEWGEAERCYERSLRVFQKVGDVYHTGLAYLHLAEARLGQGELESARGFCDKARELFRKIDDRLGIADTARVLASIHREEREFEVGEECLRQAMEAYEELDDRLNLAETSFELGIMLEERGEGEEAFEYLKRAKGLFQALGAKEGGQKADERLAHLDS
ncbi:MAG: tetratricopeptide repeat protein, partial [Anaerolineae bacterium]